MAETSKSADAGTTTPAQTRARRKTAETTRSTAGKKAAQTRARRSAATTAKRTPAARKAAKAPAAAATPVLRWRGYAEKAVVVPVGAWLEARDEVVSTVGDLRVRFVTVKGAQGELRARQDRLEASLRRYERRGASARDRLERDVRSARSRVGRGLRGWRTQASTTGKDVAAQADLVAARVEHVVQSGLTAGTQAAAKVTERVANAA